MWLPQQNNLDCRPNTGGIALLRVKLIDKLKRLNLVNFLLFFVFIYSFPAQQSTKTTAKLE
jgi:hypothetical protein